MVTVDDLAKQVAALNDSLVAIRRELHRHPELAFEETWTAEYVASRMESLGMEVERGLGVTGVLGILKGAQPGRTVLLRSQMDGLAMPEPEDRPYHALIENRNHACGHDVNMTLVLGAAHVLASRRDQIAGQVAFVFQPAEEPQVGARRMIEEGLFDRVEPDYVIAHHPMDNLAAGKVVAQAGPIWGSVDVLKLTITGQRPELDAPHGGADAMLMAGEVITSLYAMAHRERPLQEPVVFRVASIQGPRPGQSQPQVEIVMRVTTYNKQVQETLCRRIEDVAAGIVGAMQGSYTLENTHSLPPVVNHPVPAEALVNAVCQTVGVENLVQSWRNTFPEDFVLFMERAPGAVFGIGTTNPAKGVTGRFHQPDYDIDEDSLAPGVEIMARATLALLNRG